MVKESSDRIRKAELQTDPLLTTPWHCWEQIQLMQHFMSQECHALFINEMRSVWIIVYLLHLQIDNFSFIYSADYFKNW